MRQFGRKFDGTRIDQDSPFGEHARDLRHHYPDVKKSPQGPTLSGIQDTSDTVAGAGSALPKPVKQPTIIYKRKRILEK